ncbi:alpha/beta hydrolase [Metabacillus sp. HB246100]
MKKIVIGSLIFLSYLFFIGFFFSNKMMYIKKKSDQELMDRDTDLGLFQKSNYDKLEKKEFTIPSRFGYDIKGLLVAPHQTNRYIIICHGVTVNKLNSVKYMNLFLEKGFNVVIYDHRRHGDSGGKTTSYGHYEKYDLQSVVHWVKKQVGESLSLGIHGESMGAVTTLLYAGMVEDAADFYIADCPFTDLEAQLAYRLKVEFKLPSYFVLPIAKPFIKLRDHYSLHEVSPFKAVQTIRKPVLFIHSKEDDYIPFDMTSMLYEKKKGPKKLFLAEKGAHAMSYAKNREEYSKAIDEFLAEFTF